MSDANAPDSSRKYRCYPFFPKPSNQPTLANDLTIPALYTPVEGSAEIDDGLVSTLSSVAKKPKQSKLPDSIKEVRKRNTTFGRFWTQIPHQDNVDLKAKICLDALNPCLKAIKSLCQEPNNFIHVVFLSQTAVKLVTSVYLAAMHGTNKRPIEDLASHKKQMLTLVREIREAVRPILKEAQLPTGAVNVSLSRIEIGIKAIPNDAESKQALQAGFNIFVGVGQAVASWKLNSQLTAGVVQLATLGMDKVIRKQADHIFQVVAFCEHQAVSLQQKVLETKETKHAKEQLERIQADAVRENRWEVLAAFVDVIASVVLGDGTGLKGRTIHDIDVTFLEWAILGDQSEDLIALRGHAAQRFLGLQGLSALGEDLPVKDRMDKGVDVPFVALDRWAGHAFDLVKKARLDGSSVLDGIQLCQGNVEAAVQTLQNRLLASLSNESAAVEKVISCSVLQPFCQAHQIVKSGNKKRDYEEASKKLTSVQEGLKKAEKALNVFRKANLSLTDTLSQSRRVADQASSFVSKLKDLFGSADDAAFAKSEVDGELKRNLAELRKAFAKSLAQMKKCNFDPMPASPVFSDASAAAKSFVPWEIALSAASEPLEDAVRIASAMSAVALLMNTQWDGAWERVMAAASRFRTVVQSQRGLVSSAMDSMPKLDKMDAEQQQRARKALTAITAENLQHNFAAGRSIFDEVQKTLADVKEKLPEPAGVGSAAVKESLSAAESICLLATRLERVAWSLKDLEDRAGSLQDLCATACDDLMQDATERVKACRDLLLKITEAPDTDTSVANDKKLLGESLAELQPMMVGYKPSAAATGDPVGPAGPFEFASNSLTAVLSGTGTRRLALLADCSRLLESCSAVARFKDTDMRIGQRLVPLSDLAPDVQVALHEKLQSVKEEMSGIAAQAASEEWKEVTATGRALANDYGDELEAVSGVLRGALDMGRGLWEMVKGNAASKSRGELWRVRDRAVFQLMAVRAAMQLKPPSAPGAAGGTGHDDDGDAEPDPRWTQLLHAVDYAILRRRALEQVPGVMTTLQSEVFVKMMATVVKEGLRSSEEKLKDEIDERLRTVIDLEDQLMAEQDPVRKQVGLISLHREKAALERVVLNVEDMNTHFGVLRSTLDQMTKHLEVIGQKLDSLTDLVKDMQQDIRRLVGLPPLVVLEQYRQAQIASGMRMRSEVYIEPHCSSKNPDHKGKRLMDVATNFLSSDKGCLLVSGRAGSGKSVFASKLEQVILNTYSEKKAKEENKTVVLIWANLPALKNPLTGLFEEALQKYHFLPDQVRRLREQIQHKESEVEAVFVLDGYDELRPEFLFRNLYKTNNLEAYRPARDKDSNELLAFPKVIILCREELLSTNPDGYKAAFLPLETLNVHKDEVHEAQNYFDEVEIASMDSSKFAEYAREYVALNVRSAFVEAFPHYHLLPKGKDWADPKVLRFLFEADDGTATPPTSNSDPSALLPGGVQPSAPPGGLTGSDVNAPDDAGQVMTAEAAEIPEPVLRWLQGHVRDNQASVRLGNDAEEPTPTDTASQLWTIEELAQAQAEVYPAKVHTVGNSQVKQQLQALAKSLSAPLQAADEAKTKGLMADLRHKMANVVRASRAEPGDPAGADPAATATAMAASSKDESWVLDRSDAMAEFRLMFHFLVHASGSAYGPRVEDELARFQEEMARRKLWTADTIVSEYRELPELEELTSTPFMIKIVVKILPLLKELSATLSSVKQELILRLNEALADVSWAALQKKQVNNDDAIKAVQSLMDLAADGRDTSARGVQFRDFVGKQLRLLLEEVVSQFATAAFADTDQDDAPTMSEEQALQAISRSLKRKPVRRFLVYYEFMKNFSEHESQKVQRGGRSLNPQQLQNDFWEFSQRLAVKMTADVLTKVTYHPGSVIFSDTALDEWHPFFGSGDQRQAHRDEVRRVAPLKSQGGTYSFMHKSVQEFFVAMAVRDSLLALVKQTLIAPPALDALFQKIRSVHEAGSSLLLQSPNTKNQTSLSEVRGEEEESGQDIAMKYIQEALDRVGGASKAAERKRQAKAINRLVQGLHDGALNAVDLSSEEAVRDFLLDALLDDIQVAASFVAVASLCLTESLHQGKLRFVAENLRTLFTAAMPKREGNSLLHIAGKEGNLHVVEMVLDFCLDERYSAAHHWDWRPVLVPKNRDGHAPLMTCLDAKNWEMCSLLLSKCSTDEMKKELISDCETRKSELSALDVAKHADGFAESMPYMLRSGETMFVTSGKAYYQVTLDLQQLQELRLEDAVHGACGSFGIGFAAGKPPDVKHVVKRFDERDKTSQEETTAAAKLQTRLDKTRASETGQGAYDAWRGRTEGGRDQQKQHKEVLASQRKLWTTATNRRLRTFPLGGANTPGSFHNVTGLALHVIKPFDAVFGHANHRAKLELLCERIVVPMQDEVEAESVLPQDLPIGNSKAPLAVFPDRTLQTAPGRSMPNLRRQASGLDRREAVLALDLTKTLKDNSRHAFIGISIDFQTEEHEDVVVQCCWTTKAAAGEWRVVAKVPKSNGPFYPVVSSWGFPDHLDIRPEIDLGDRHDGFKIAPPGESILFQPYKKAMRGMPGHYRMGKEGEWDLFFRLVNEMEQTEHRYELLTYLDPDTGMTLLHTLVHPNESAQDETESDSEVCRNIETLLRGAKQSLDNDGAAKSVEDVVLAKDAQGFSALSLVSRPAVAKCIMEHVKDVGAKGEMLNHLINRLYRDTSEIGDADDSGFGVFEQRVVVWNLSHNAIKQEASRLQKQMQAAADKEQRDKAELALTRTGTVLEQVIGTLLRKARRLKENMRFFQCCMDGLSVEVAGIDVAGSQDASSLGHLTVDDFDSQEAEIEGVQNQASRDALQPGSDDNAGVEDKASVDAVSTKSSAVEEQARWSNLHIEDSESQAGGSDAVSESGMEGTQSQAAGSAAASKPDTEGSDDDEPKIQDLIAFFILPMYGMAGMQLLREDLKDEWDVVRVAVRSDPRSLEEAGKAIRTSLKNLTEAVRYDGLALSGSLLSAEHDDFPELVNIAVSCNGLALQYAQGQKSDKATVLAAVTNNGLALQHADRLLQFDMDVVKAAASQNCFALRFADIEKMLELDRDATLAILQTAVQEDGLVLEHFPEIAKDVSIVLAALSSSGRAIRHVPEVLLQNKEVVQRALESDPGTLLFLRANIPGYAEPEGLSVKMLKQSPLLLPGFTGELKEDKALQVSVLTWHPTAAFEITESLGLEDEVGERMLETLNSQSYVACWSCVVFFLLLEDTDADSKTDAVLTVCRWLFRALSTERQPDVAESSVANTASGYEELILCAARWKRGSGDLPEMAETWSHLIRLMHELVELDFDEEDPGLKQQRDAVYQLVRASIAAEGMHGALLEFSSPSDKKDVKLVLQAIKKSKGAAFQFATDLHANKQVATEAISLDPMAMRYIETLKVDVGSGGIDASKQAYEELARMAVRLDGLALEHVKSEHLPGPESFSAIAMEAIRCNGMAIRHDPKPSHALCRMAVKDAWRAIEHVPQQVKGDPAFAKFAVERDGRALGHLPEAARDNKALVMAAVQSDGTALQFASAKLREDHEVCMLAVKQNSMALQFVESEDFVTHANHREVVGDAVKRNGSLLEAAPHDMCSNKDVVRCAVISDVLALQYAFADFDAKELQDILCENLAQHRQYHFELPKSLTHLAHNVEIDSLNKTIDFKDFATVICPRMLAVRGCRTYYEVEIVRLDDEEPWMQFGFADQTFNPVQTAGGEVEGVGDSEEGSFALDGFREQLWTNHDSKDWNTETADEFGGFRSFRVGMVIGFLCDPMRGSISFWADGNYFSTSESQDYRNAFEQVSFVGPGLFPALSGRGIMIRYNLGEPQNGEKPLQFSNNPLAKTHNMHEWFFKAAEDEEPTSSSSPPLSAGDKDVRTIIRLSSGTDEDEDEILDEVRACVAHITGGDIDEVFVTPLHRAKNCVDVSVLVWVPAERAADVVAQMTQSNLRKWLQDQDIERSVQVLLEARVQGSEASSRVPSTVTAEQAGETATPSLFKDVAVTLPDIDAVVREDTTLRYQPAHRPPMIHVPLASSYKILAGNHVGYDYTQFQAHSIQSPVIAVPPPIAARIASDGTRVSDSPLTARRGFAEGLPSRPSDDPAAGSSSALSGPQADCVPLKRVNRQARWQHRASPTAAAGQQTQQRNYPAGLAAPLTRQDSQLVSVPPTVAAAAPPGSPNRTVPVNNLQSEHANNSQAALRVELERVRQEVALLKSENESLRVASPASRVEGRLPASRHGSGLEGAVSWFTPPATPTTSSLWASPVNGSQSYPNTLSPAAVPPPPIRRAEPPASGQGPWFQV